MNSLVLRQAAWKQLGEEVLDIFVIGGGINGAAVARDAILRGLSVALVEQNDFASGTSSRSSKLIHGGVRYLEQGDVGLVLEACRERDLLRTRLAPHLVRAQPFVFPIYEDDDLPLWQLRAGLFLYDVLATFRNVRNHEGLSRERVCEVEPALLHDKLRGGALYYDCWTDDARLTLETVLAARTSGAAVLNHCQVTALEKDSGGRIAAAVVRDRLSGETKTVHARCFVNVAGPWLDRVRQLDDPGAAPRLRATKGVHAVFERSKIRNRNAVVIRGVGDDRVMFAIPWQSQTLIGTTDTYYEGDPAEVAADRDDIDYLVATTNRAFPDANVTVRDVISTYAGLRPLVAPEDELDESAVSRDDQIFESPSGMISLGGGKLTTHRHVAEQIVDRAARSIGRSIGRSRTRHVALPGAAGVAPGHVRDGEPLSVQEHIRARYGAFGPQVSALVGADDALAARLSQDRPEIKAEVLWAVDHEMAMTVEDVLSRRLQIALRSRSHGRDVADQTATLMAEYLGWDEQRLRDEVEKYTASAAPLADQGQG